MSASDPVPSQVPGACADRMIASAARAADGARSRLSGAINDLFRPPETRLNDREHALMTRMLASLIAEIEHALRQAMASDAIKDADVASELLDADRPIALPRLARSRILRDADLAELLLRRCDEHHVACRLQQAYPGADGALESLSAHPDLALRHGIARLLSGESRRVDSFGDPLVLLDDTPLILLHRLGWWVAAMLREYLLDRMVDEESADHALAIAVRQLVEGHDIAGSVDHHAARLAELLDHNRMIDGFFLAGLLHDGQIALWVACLAVRSGIEAPAIWTMLADPDASRLTLLLRAIELERMTALGMLAALFAARQGARAENDLRLTEAALAFDALDVAAAQGALRPYGYGRHDILTGQSGAAV